VEDRHAVAVQVDAVEHQAMQMNIQIGRRAEALNEHDRAGVGSGGSVGELSGCGGRSVGSEPFLATSVLSEPGEVELVLPLRVRVVVVEGHVDPGAGELVAEPENVVVRQTGSRKTAGRDGDVADAESRYRHGS
jgi:hypothetical protein